jgi:hypothetical protein
MVEAARASVVYYHELPLWNPYECGGVPLWDNPQAPISTPLLWVMLLVPTARAIEIWYIAHTAVGFMCMWIFARRELRLGSTATFLASAVWTFAGVHWHHLTGGSLTWVPFFYAPLMLFLWRHAERDRRLAVALGALIALTIYEGGVYPLAFAVVFLGAETLTRAWRCRHTGRAEQATDRGPPARSAPCARQVLAQDPHGRVLADGSGDGGKRPIFRVGVFAEAEGWLKGGATPPPAH